MMLLEAGRASSADRILATDVSDAALAHARAGYTDAGRCAADCPSWRGTSSAGRDGSRWFRRPGAWSSSGATTWSPRRRPAGPFDVVVCRNVLHLLEPAQQAPAIRTLLAALRPGGYLLLAPSEVSLTSTMLVERVSASGATLLRRPWPRPSRRPLRPAELPAAPPRPWRSPWPAGNGAAGYRDSPASSRRRSASSPARSSDHSRPSCTSSCAPLAGSTRT